MDLSYATLLGFDVLQNATAVINSKNVVGIFNQSRHVDNKVLGGYEPDDAFDFIAKTSDLTNPKSLKGVKISINSIEYRIISILYGEYVTRLQCQSIHKA